MTDSEDSFLLMMNLIWTKKRKVARLDDFMDLGQVLCGGIGLE